MARRQEQSFGLGQYRLFSLFGFAVKPDLSWLLLALLISWSLGAGVFPVDYPGLSKQVYAWMGITGAAIAPVNPGPTGSNLLLPVGYSG